ncbi:MAG: HAD family hydrolase [Kiritimatiellia bacterium]
MSPRFNRAILFDMDGVLVNTEPLLLQAVIRMLAQYGVDASRDKPNQWYGASEREFYAGMAGLHGLPYREAMEPLVRREFRRLVCEAPNRAVYPESIPVLSAFNHSPDLGLAVCSGAGRWKVEINLESLAPAGCPFHEIVSGDDVARSKPAPDIFLEGARRLGVPPSRCLVIEDTTAGLRAAAAAGMRAIAVTHTYPADALRALPTPPVAILPHLSADTIRSTLQTLG